MDWTDWAPKDQFGWEQPALAAVVGANGRSKLSGRERPHNYQVGLHGSWLVACGLRLAACVQAKSLWHVACVQVAVSFPGADFNKGSESHGIAITDHEGKTLAASGTEMAEALRRWLVEGWLDNDETQGMKQPSSFHYQLRGIERTRCAGYTCRAESRLRLL